MVRHTLAAFAQVKRIAQVWVVVSPGDDTLRTSNAAFSIAACGGVTRAESVFNGLNHLLANGAASSDWVLVHDAARPGLDDGLIEKLITNTGEHPVGGVLALPVVDTVKRCIAGEVGTVSREGMWLAQTPQMFRYKLLRDALAAARDPHQVTDDASAVEALGLSPKLVEGHPRNLKVTLPGDIRIAEMYLATTQPELL